METKIYGDLLTRSKTVEDIVAIVNSCANMKKSMTFSVEGEWGRGKTWVIQKVTDSLNGIDLTKEQQTKTKKKCNGDYLVFTYNAWEKDYYAEPLFGMLITIINQLNKELILENILKAELATLYKETKNILEECLRAISMRIIGVDIVDLGKHGVGIIKNVNSKSRISLETDCAENNVEKDIQLVVKVLDRLAKTTPIIFIVDELDRCMPNHAVKTLERLHHIFGKIDSSVTIIAVNEKQLRKTVEQMFGADIPFESYLRKFVDFRINLDSGNADTVELQNKLKHFLDLFGEPIDDSSLKEILTSLCGLMTAREFEKVCNNALLCHQLSAVKTISFPKECAIAEIMLFACKIAIEKEGGRANIVPIFANEPKTKIAKFIKAFFNRVPSNSIISLSNSFQLTHYICMMGLLTKEEIKRYTINTLTSLESEILNYYYEYIRYYKMLK